MPCGNRSVFHASRMAMSKTAPPLGECKRVVSYAGRVRQSPVNHRFLPNGKFAFLTVNNVDADLPSAAFQLSDGRTWVMPGVPVPDLGVWKEWIGSIRMERLSHANLVLFVEESSDNPEMLDGAHERLQKDLSVLFYLLHLCAGIEIANGADLLCGSSKNGLPRIRQMSEQPVFNQSRGWKRAPITQAWLEDGLVLRTGVAAMDAEVTQFRRLTRGLNTLFNGLKETHQDRIHQFVRSLEAIILPDIGKTKKQFAHRCQTLAPAGNDTRDLLLEAFDMRSDTEHLNPWDEAVKSYPADLRDDLCWQRTRQIERLACDAYSRILRDAELRSHFRTEAAIADFWKLPEGRRQALWGPPIDIANEPLVRRYDQWGRAMA